jgi:hypothetical protein
MIKKAILLGFLGIVLLISLALPDAQVRQKTIRFKMYHSGDTLYDRYFRDTFELTDLKMLHSAQEIDGKFIFDSTTYDTGAFGNADTVRMILKSVFGDGALAKYYTLDSTQKVFAWGLGVNCTLNVTFDTDSLGERLILIVYAADTLNAGVANTAGDTIDGTIRYNILHRYRD